MQFIPVTGVPADISVADKTAAVIEFTAPEVNAKTEYQFTLFVCDNKNAPSSWQRFVLTVVQGGVAPTPTPEPIPEPSPEPTP